MDASFPPLNANRRRLQFSLLTLLVIMLISGPLLAWLWKKSTERSQSGPVQVVATTGRITFADGTPVAGAQLAFTPTVKGFMATAVTDQLGRFEMSTFEEADGAAPGNYSVIVHDLHGMSFAKISLSSAKPSPTPLTISVVAGKPNSFHIVVE